MGNRINEETILDIINPIGIILVEDESDNCVNIEVKGEDSYSILSMDTENSVFTERSFLRMEAEINKYYPGSQVRMFMDWDLTILDGMED